jgi:hypothetical protein
MFDFGQKGRPMNVHLSRARRDEPRSLTHVFALGLMGAAIMLGIGALAGQLWEGPIVGAVTVFVLLVGFGYRRLRTLGGP